MVGLAHGMAAQRLFDALLHIWRRGLLIHPDVVDDADHAAQLADRAFGQLFLVAPVDVARQRDPAALDANLDDVQGHMHVPLQRVASRLGNGFVEEGAGRMHVELDDDRSYA
ncbi:hypothetical protein D9M70_450160 [compost metagenome]